MRNISILGSTGSIGTQALEVARQNKLRVLGLSAFHNINLLCAQAVEFSPEMVAIMDGDLAAELKNRLFGKNIKVVAGMEGLCEVAARTGADIVLTAVVGSAGILPTVEAIAAKKDIALANKETLVAAGEIVIPLAKKNGVKLLPVDSEHSAIFQCLMAAGEKTLPAKLILCASGGPFFGRTRGELEQVTVEEALKHPSWSMGKKITIDSATLMNKGFEVIEAHHLFAMPLEKIEVIVHRQSMIHSMVEYADKAVIAQLGKADMKMAISFAFAYPGRATLNTEPIDFTKMGSLTFAAPDYDTFGCLGLCIQAAKIGGTAPAALNAANEVAVDKFLNRKIKFLDIEHICKKALEEHQAIENPSLQNILDTDKKTREHIETNFTE